MRFIALLAVLSCTTSKSAEQHAEVAQEIHAEQQAKEQSAASGRTATGPETITTTTEEWESGVRESNPSDRFGRPVPLPIGQPRTDAVSAPPLLVKRTVTVDQRGPVDSSWMASASGTQGAESQTSLQAHVEAQSASKTSYWPPWWVWAGAALALAAALWLARGKLKLALDAVRALVG